MKLTIEEVELLFLIVRSYIDDYLDNNENYYEEVIESKEFIILNNLFKKICNSLYNKSKTK